MDRNDVARSLLEIAAFLELKGENPFRVRAYQQAARAIQAYAGDLQTAIANGVLAEMKGVGPATETVVRDLLATGQSRVLEQLRDEVAPGLVEMLGISGLGVAKVRQIHEDLHVHSLDELEEAARDGRLARLPRFGAKTAANVLKGIASLRQSVGARLLHHARTAAADLERVLGQLPEIRRVMIVGAVRRYREIVRDLDFVVEPAVTPDVLYDRLGRAPGVTEFVRRQERAVTLRFAGGTVADIFLATPDQWGFHVLRGTGSAEHVAALHERATGLGLTWTDAGLTRDGVLVPTKDEAAAYRLLNLPVIPPELREGRGEIEAAVAGKLPQLVERKDMRGFLHCHSNYSDGTNTVAEWAEGAVAAGYEYIGLTDHSEAALESGGLRGADIGRQHAEIDAVNRQCSDVHMLKGVEADILEDGTVDYTDEERRSFDFVIASIHTRFGQDERTMTDRVIRAMDDPTVAILGHPTGRLLLARDPFPLNLDRVFRAAAERGVAIEINADPQRLDLDWRHVREAAAMGVIISIGADAHGVNQMSHADVGVALARKGWLTANQVLNARPLSGFLEHVAARRG
ncbi:MAG: DNA polymerase/3'-5' exonuclease PolX [Gemmatimonadales bacterium]